MAGAIKLSERQNEIIEIIEIIKSDNRISYRAIAKKLDINDSAVDKHIKSLKEK
ncbi:MAG: winged helix-turn-helix transcriptional regulator, partial [Candidatus Aminicenantes bacterium]